VAFETWSVAILLRATDQASRVFLGTANAARTANTQISAQNKLLAINAERQRLLNSRMKLYGGIAAGLAIGIGVGIKQASNLQQAIVAVGIATETSGKQLLGFQNLAMRMSGVTAQSVGTIAQEMAAAASAGLNKPSQLTAAFPTMAKAADVMWLSPKHINPVEAVTQMSTLSHLFGKYQGPEFERMITRATQMMFVQPEALKSLINQGRMFIGPALSRGVSEEDIFRQAMTMGQTGFLKGRGGSGLARVIEYLSGAATMTGHLSKIQHAAMRSLGLTNASGVLNSEFRDKGGNLLLQKAVDHLEHIRKAFSPTDFGNLLTNAFLAQGGRYMATTLLPSVYEKSAQNWKQMLNLGSIESMWKKYSDTFTFGLQNFITNAQNVLGAIFLPILPALTAGLKAAGAAMGALAQYLMGHTKVALGIAVGAFAAVALTAAAAARNMWALNAAILSGGLGGGARAGVSVAEGAAGGSILARGVGFLRGALGFLSFGLWPMLENIVVWGSRFVPIVGIVTAALALLYLQFRLMKDTFVSMFTGRSEIADAVTRWWGRNEGKIGYTIGYAFGVIGRMLQQAISGLMTWAGAGIGSFFSNIGMLLSPGGIGALAAKMQADSNAAAAAYAKEHHVGFGDAGTAGYYQGASGQPYNPNYDPSHRSVTIHVDRPIMQIGPGVTEAHARAAGGWFWDQVVKHTKAASDQSGSLFPVTPYHPAPAFGSP
jgi:hypothetical protein